MRVLEPPMEQAAEPVWNILNLSVHLLVGLAIAAVLAMVSLAIGKALAKRHPVVPVLGRRIYKAGIWAFLLLGLFSGWMVYIESRVTPLWLDYFAHGLLICLIASLTWLVTRSLYVFEDIANHHLEQDVSNPDLTPSQIERARRSRTRVLTQAQILRRVVQALVVAAGAVAIVLTFPQMRVAMSSLLASAGIASIVATLAAQSALANVFAGLQIALTDAIRVGDTVVVSSVDGKKEQGSIEEITLTYVVVTLVDERRLVVPSTQFTQQKFENWSRKEAEQLGGVELRLDFGAPVEQIRAHALEWIENNPLWDKRVSGVAVTDSTETSMTVRVLVSAADAGALWTLRCNLREEMYRWLSENYPASFVRTRFESAEVSQKIPSEQE